ncbi:MAG: hypothetical protein BZY88_06765 [SAR202 cluster bacterium Io17-Chloro-G9]|nr:MAG: hypothetical protein BZY88_06765 [SAR202 cluster bacterium Io17-Chloro-G9]
MKKVRFLALLAVAALLLIFPAVVMGQPVPPHVSKLVVSVDGNPAADGTEVTVWMDDAQVASATTTGGLAIIRIDGEASSSGKAINFKVEGVDASEADAWEQGGHVDKAFAVSITSTAPTTAPAPTAMPAKAIAGKDGAKGEKGDKGDTGAAGPPGKAGSGGKAGADGKAGAAGAAGKDGAPGTAGSAGSAGPAGADGGGGVLGIIALILAIVAIVGAGGAFVAGRRGA